MYDSSPRSSSKNAGHRAGLGFLLAGTLGVLVACGSDDPAPQTGAGGSDSTGQADAGPPLRGEGLESTPDFDITDRQVPVPPREQIRDSVAAIGQAGSGGNLPAPSDAGDDGGVPAAADAGSGDSGAP